jgi:hypothetical protein
MKSITYSIIHLSILYSLVFVSQALSMNSEENFLSIIPHDCLAIIVAHYDFLEIRAITEIQEQIIALQNEPYSVARPTQKSFREIQNAIFPCLPLKLTCKSFSNTFKNDKFMNKVIAKSKELLPTILPQGVGLFFLPKPMQLTIYNIINPKTLFDLCRYDEDLINKTFSIHISNTFFSSLDKQG